MLTLLAQITDPNAADVSFNTSNTLYGISNLGLLITRILQISLGVVGLLIFLYIVWGGIEWIFSGEDKGKVQAARAKITQGIVGFGVFVSVFAIFFIVSRVLGLGNRLNITAPSGSSYGSTGGNGGAQTCTGNVAVNATVNDGGSGGYCTGGGAALVKCVAAGVGPSQLPYAHYEPCSCVTGTLLPGYSTSGCQ